MVRAPKDRFPAVAAAQYDEIGACVDGTKVVDGPASAR
jgi:hypothetical protein